MLLSPVYLFKIMFFKFFKEFPHNGKQFASSVCKGYPETTRVGKDVNDESCVVFRLPGISSAFF